jgi:anti-sigma regulatory factor (Ser/Thr protein kinase)
MGSGHDLTSGACGAWPLPGDLSCAATARALYREAAAEVGIGADLAYDGVTMASELAANTLHTRAGGNTRARDRSELWIYLRGSGATRELVCKVFDTCPGWKSGATPSPHPLQAPPEAMGGRGLQVVHELSGGRWGHHLTRARLGHWKTRGKAVWFALPSPLPGGPRPAADGIAARNAGTVTMQHCSQLSARQATEKLQAMLSARGLGVRLRQDGQPATDFSVLWLSRGLTLSCRDGLVLIETPAGDRQHWTYADLVDVSERAVWMHEELERG